MLKIIRDVISPESMKTIWVLCNSVEHVMSTSSLLFENCIRSGVLGVEDIPKMKYRCQVLGKSRYHIVLKETGWRTPDFVLDITDGKEVLTEGHKYAN